jgi:nucleoid DNA-binding protein
MTATNLSESDFAAELAKRLPWATDAQVKKFIKAFKEEVTECVNAGYKVSLSGLLSIEPIAKPGRKKGTVVRNPFDGSEKTLRADEPPKFAVKVKRSPSIAKGFPSIKTNDGKQLYMDLTGKRL